MATLKRVEKRLETVENWLKQFEQGAGPKQTMDNMNWLVGQSRLLGDRLSEAEKNPDESEVTGDDVNKDDGDIVDADFEDLDDQKK